MLKFFRHNYVIQWAVIVIIAIVASIPMFLQIPDELPQISGTAPLYLLLAKIVGQSPLIMSMISFAVFVFSMFFFNTILTSNQLSSRNSTFGSLTFILCFACLPMSCENFQFMLACPFIMASMQTLYPLLQNENPEPYLFNVGFFMAFASMFYYPSIVLILWVLLVIPILGYKQFRLFLIPFYGLAIPYFFMFVIAYFRRSIPELFETYSKGFCGIEIQEIDLTIQEIVAFPVLILLLILSYLKIKTSSSNSIHARKRNAITLLMLVFALFMLVIQLPISSNGLIFLILAIFYASALSTIKKSRIADIMIVICMAGALASQYLPLFI